MKCRHYIWIQLLPVKKTVFCLSPHYMSQVTWPEPDVGNQYNHNHINTNAKGKIKALRKVGVHVFSHEHKTIQSSERAVRLPSTKNDQKKKNNTFPRRVKVSMWPKMSHYIHIVITLIHYIRRFLSDFIFGFMDLCPSDRSTLWMKSKLYFSCRGYSKFRA